MLVSFQSKVGRITMHGNIAVPLIRIMGRTGSVPGAILVSEIPEAIASLRKAMDTEEAEATQSKEDGADEENSAISLRHRALPLIGLLQDAQREGSDVMWEQLGSGPLQF